MIKTPIPSQDVKERILDVSRNLFITKGFDATGIREIASAAETNVAMVNYYFQSKYNLFEIIFEESFDLLVNKIFQIIDSDMPFFELIEQWIDTYYEVLLEHPQLPIFILNEINRHPNRLAKRIQKHQPVALFDRMAKKIEHEIQKNTIVDTPPLDFVLNIMSMCIFPFIFGRMVVKVTEKSISEYRDIIRTHKKYVIEFVINAIKK